jgi:hypothetical protein
MNTIENNKLIAQFMGFRAKMNRPDVYSYSDLPFFSCTYDTPEKVLESFAGYAKYRSSWDWLMPVVDKCSDKNMNMFADEFNVELYMFTTNDIEAVYEKVVEFINWYNKNK